MHFSFRQISVKDVMPLGGYVKETANSDLN